MDLIWSALITNREFSLLDNSITNTEFWEQNEPKTLQGRVDINEHEIKVELGNEILRIYHINKKIIVSRDNGITKEILLGEKNNGNH